MCYYIFSNELHANYYFIAYFELLNVSLKLPFDRHHTVAQYLWDSRIV